MDLARAMSVLFFEKHKTSTGRVLKGVPPSTEHDRNASPSFPEMWLFSLTRSVPDKLPKTSKNFYMKHTSVQIWELKQSITVSLSDKTRCSPSFFVQAHDSMKTKLVSTRLRPRKPAP